jgi:Zn-dependent peptidase ImmA (M78 family)
MDKKYRYGFKSETEDYAKEFRKELGLAPHHPLCPWKLATLLEIPVEPLSCYRARIPDAVIHFTETESNFFSAVTIFNQYRRLIIHNDSHAPNRQAANIAHELSHSILGHIPKPIFDEYGNRQFNDQDEDEADWFGPVLLVPKDAAFHIVKTEMSVEKASKIYGASREVITMRVNLSGARKVFARAKKKASSYS